VIGEGNQNLTWPRAVVRRVKESVKTGVKLFNRHNEDNSTSGRKSVGEVITTFTTEIKGKLRAVAIAAMEKADSLVYDICSIEANVWEENGIVGDVDRVTGIAVSSSKIDQPAFKNAKRMQIVQCFTEPVEPAHLEKEKTMITLEDLMSAPISLIQQAAQARQMHPSQLFSEDDIQKDRNFENVFKERTEFADKIKTLEKELGTEKERADKAEKVTQKSTAKDMLTKRMPRGTTDKQKEFITNRFDPDKMDDLSETAIDEFIKTGKSEFQEMAKMFGTAKDDTTPNEDEDDIPGDDGEVSIDDAFLEE